MHRQERLLRQILRIRVPHEPGRDAHSGAVVTSPQLDKRRLLATTQRVDKLSIAALNRPIHIQHLAPPLLNWVVAASTPAQPRRPHPNAPPVRGQQLHAHLGRESVPPWREATIDQCFLRAAQKPQ